MRGKWLANARWWDFFRTLPGCSGQSGSALQPCANGLNIQEVDTGFREGAEKATY
jgi:hypothetical protein